MPAARILRIGRSVWGPLGSLACALALGLVACSPAEDAPPAPDLGSGADSGPERDSSLDLGPAQPDDLGSPDLGYWPDLAPYREDRPSLRSVEPAAGRAAGGETVLLRGGGFIYATAVRFGGRPVASFQVAGPDRIRVVTPAGEPGLVDVEVDGEGGLAVLAEGFRYVAALRLDSVDPPQVSVLGGSRVRVQGAGFAGDPPELLVGAGRASDLRVESDGSLSAVVPPHEEGPADLWAFARGEQAVLRQGLLYRAAPQVESLRPAEGPLAGGSSVLLEGLGLYPELRASLGASELVPSGSVDGRSLRFLTPPAAAPGAVDLLLSGPAGELLIPKAFVYLADDGAPRLYGASPAEGPAAGGGEVLLLGEGLAADATVRFGAALSSCHRGGDARLRCVVPPGSPGSVDLVLKQSPGVLLRAAQAYRYLPALGLDSVRPASGPEAGGAAVELVGRGFAPGLQVTFGGVAARDLRIHPGGERVSCTSPPGSAGPVDVRVVQGGQGATLPLAYTYEGPIRLLAVDPPEGSLAGGTWLRLIGTGLRADLGVLIGGHSPSEVRWLGPTALAVRSPPADEEGPVDVQIPGVALLPEGFRYFDPYSGAGGVWGGPIQGSVNVSVRSSYDGGPIADALVMLGADASAPAARTDPRGLVTVSTLDLYGPLDLHAGHPDYEPAGFLGIDGRNATFFLVPKVYPSQPGGGGGGDPVIVDGTIRGMLYGLDKYVPIPDDPAWERVALVETTRTSLFGGNPSPGPGGTLSADGPYEIVSRPGDVAVVAVGGWRNLQTNEFRPWRMGMHRYLFLPMQGLIEGADLVLDVAMNHRMAVTLITPPYDLDQGPDRLELRPWLEFQPEGYFHPRNLVTTSNREFWLPAMPDPAASALEGATLQIEAGIYTNGSRPYSLVFLPEVALDAETLELGPFVGLPRLVAPDSTRSLTQYAFEWTVHGDTEPTVYSIRMLGPDLQPAWRLIFGGPRRSLRLPEVEGIFQVPYGRSYLAVTAGVYPAFDPNDFSYGNLSVRAWDSWSVDYLDFLHSPPPGWEPPPEE